MPSLCPFDLGEPTERLGGDLAVVLTERARHRQRPRQLLEVFGGRAIVHPVMMTAGCDGRGHSCVDALLHAIDVHDGVPGIVVRAGVVPRIA